MIVPSFSIVFECGHVEHHMGEHTSECVSDLCDHCLQELIDNDFDVQPSNTDPKCLCDIPGSVPCADCGAGC